MQPLEPNDSLWKLLGKARPVEPRPDFTQNVVRQARQTPQQRGWLAALREWIGAGETPLMPRLAWAAASVAAVAILLQGVKFSSGPQVAPVIAEQSQVVPAMVAPGPEALPLTDVETQLENIEQVNALLALEDTSTLTDTEISFLLY